MQQLFEARRQRPTAARAAHGEVRKILRRAFPRRSADGLIGGAGVSFSRAGRVAADAVAFWSIGRRVNGSRHFPLWRDNTNPATNKKNAFDLDGHGVHRFNVNFGALHDRCEQRDESRRAENVK